MTSVEASAPSRGGSWVARSAAILCLGISTAALLTARQWTEILAELGARNVPLGMVPLTLIGFALAAAGTVLVYRGSRERLALSLLGASLAVEVFTFVAWYSATQHFCNCLK